MSGTYVTISLVAENLEDRLPALMALTRRFAVTALPDHASMFAADPSMEMLAKILHQQKEEVQHKKAELSGAIYRVILQPCSPLQLLILARQLGVREAEQRLLQDIQKDISDEVILIERAPISANIIELAETRFANHVHRTSNPNDEGLLDQVETSLANIGGWGPGY